MLEDKKVVFYPDEDELHIDQDLCLHIDTIEKDTLRVWCTYQYV